MRKILTAILFFLASPNLLAQQVIFADQLPGQTGSISMESALAAPERMKSTKQPSLAEQQIAAITEEASRAAELESAAVLAANAAAAKPPAAKKLALQIDLNYQQPDESGTFEICLVKNTVKTLSTNHDWMKIQDQENDNSEYFVLLSKIEEVNDNDVTMKFIVLDTTNEKIFMSDPKVVLPFGQQKKVTLTQDKQKMQLIVTAKMG